MRSVSLPCAREPAHSQAQAQSLLPPPSLPLSPSFSSPSLSRTHNLNLRMSGRKQDAPAHLGSPDGRRRSACPSGPCMWDPPLLLLLQPPPSSASKEGTGTSGPPTHFHLLLLPPLPILCLRLRHSAPPFARTPSSKGRRAESRSPRLRPPPPLPHPRRLLLSPQSVGASRAS
jgi:hypothetical protein